MFLWRRALHTLNNKLFISQGVYEIIFLFFFVTQATVQSRVEVRSSFDVVCVVVVEEEVNLLTVKQPYGIVTVIQKVYYIIDECDINLPRFLFTKIFFHWLILRPERCERPVE